MAATSRLESMPRLRGVFRCFQVVCPLILLIGSPSLPRSPRWLISKGHTEEAFEVIKKNEDES